MREPKGIEYSLPVKREEIAEIESDVEAFLAAGGKITQCDSGDRSEPIAPSSKAWNEIGRNQ